MSQIAYTVLRVDEEEDTVKVFNAGAPSHEAALKEVFARAPHIDVFPHHTFYVFPMYECRVFRNMGSVMLAVKEKVQRDRDIAELKRLRALYPNE